MADPDGPPLDELVYTREDIVNWRSTQGGQPMDEDMIHRYLNESPFMDRTTKNGQQFISAANNPDPRANTFVDNRRTIEHAVSQLPGAEYMIVDEPKPQPGSKDIFPRDTTGIYVVRKQDRQRVQGYDGRTTEELTTLETFYTHDIKMFKAASVADTVGNRLLHAQRHIQAFADVANGLPSFDPAMGGYYYLKPSSKPATAPGSTPGPGTPGRSREGSVADAHSVRSGSIDLSSGNSGSGDPRAQALEDRLLQESLAMSLQFGDEYMDENPILGEPGKFTFTSSTAAVKKRKADEEAAAAKAKAEKEGKSAAFTPKIGKAPAPPMIMSEAKAAKDKRNSGKLGEKIKRKKSKGDALSPTTPGAGATLPL